MFKNKCFICIFLIFALLSICAVNAEDSSLSNITSTEDIAVNLEVNDNEKLNSQIAIDDEESNSQIASGDDSVVEKPKVKNFTVLKNEIGNLANNDTLNLNCDYIHNGSGEPEYAYIFKNVTINGNGHIIDFNKSNFDFGFYGQYNSVIFKNFIFINAGGVENTSLVFHNNIDYGCFSIINSTFINHTAHSLLYTHESNLSVVNCSFINNTASEAVININWGGYALVANCSFVNCSNSIVNFNLCDVINSTFVNNTARQYETIISTYGRGTIDNSIFENNTIENCGIANSGEMFIITNSKFINTKVSGSGIVISNYDGVANISNCTFMVNGEGSYIFKNTQSNVTIANSTFLNTDLAFAYNNHDAIFNLTNNEYHGFSENNYIYNMGILTSVVVNILANQTIKTNPGNKITLFATITSDGVSVVDYDFYFIINETKYRGYDLGNGSYVFNYTVNFLGKEIVSGECSKANTVFVKTGTLESYKKSSNISVSVDNIVFGDNAIVNVNLTKGATGCVNITLNNKTKTFDLREDCFIRWNISALNASKYNVSVVYDGDGIYLGCSANTTFTVSKKSDYDLIVDVPKDVVIGKNATIKVTLPNNASGNITVKLGNKTYIAKNNIVNISTDNLKAGNYEIITTYEGDNNHVAKSKNSTLNVSKVSFYKMSIGVNDGDVGGNIILYMELPEDVDENITVTVDGVPYFAPVNNGTANVTLSGLGVGKYYVVFNFENDKYSFCSLDISFEVHKIKYYPLDTFVRNSTVGENVTVYIWLPDDVNENITLSVDDKNYSAVVKDGDAIVNISGLGVGEHKVYVSFENYKYEFNSRNSTFKISKVSNYKISVDVGDTYVGNDAVVCLTLPGDVNENVTLSVDDKNYSAIVTNGIASVNISDLSLGKHNVYVSFENYKYKFKSADATFKVSKISPYKMSVNVSDIYAGDVAIVSVTLPGDVNEDINITVDGKDYLASVKNGVASVNVSNLSLYQHSVVVSFENYKYAFNKIDTTFKVSKISNYPVGIEVANITLGQNATINVTLPDEINENITVAVDGVLYYTVANNGLASVNVSGLNFGDHYIFISFENYRYDYNSKEAWFTVFKISDYPIIINVSEKAIVCVTLPGDVNGYVPIEIDGEIHLTEVRNGTANLSVADLSNGEHKISITFENEKYDFNTVNTTFNISKISDYSINVDIANFTVGQIVTINITLPNDVNEYITATVDGWIYIPEVRNGIASVNVSGLNAGWHDVFVSFKNYKYSFNSVNTTFKVYKVFDYAMSVNVEDSIVKVTLPGDAVGYAIVAIDGKTQLTRVRGGIASVDASGLCVGKHDVYVNFENEKYGFNSANTTFNVPKIDDYSIIVDVGDDDIVRIILPSDVNENITVAIDGKDCISKAINGVASVGVFGLASGVHEVFVSFENDKYAFNSVNTTFSVSKIFDYAMSVDVENAFVRVTLPSDVNENITVAIDGKDCISEVRNGVAIVSVSGLASGLHDVFVSFENDKYGFNSVNTTFEVFKVSDYDFIVDVADISVGENATVSVTLPSDVNENITVKFENKTYIAKNGVVEIPTDKLSAGNYEIVTTYGGDSKYVAKSIKSTFEVSKISNYNIFVNVANVKVGQNATVDIYVPSDINESITITVDGKNYSAIVRNGVASVNVSGLASGLHDVFVSFENDKYDFNSVNTTFEVFKVSDYQMNLTIQDNIKVNLPEDADGNVSVFINGKNYTEIVKNGVVNIAIPKLPLGEYNVSVVYGGNNKYLAREINTTFSVFDDKSVVLSADDVVMIYHDSSRLIASLLYTDGNPIANKTISFTIGGVTYNKTTDENGSAYLTINLDPGFYRATVSYLGNLSVNATVLVNSTINGSDLIKMYQNATQFYATFYGKDGEPLANMSVKFNINGVFYNRTTDSNGTASLNINLNPGEYILTAYNDITGEEKGFNVFVKSLIETMDLTKYYMNASGYLVKVWNKDGSVGANKNVTFNINGVFYTAAADENGSAKLAINLIPGDYIITTFVDGLAIGNNVSVLPTLETNDLTMEYGDGSVFSAKTLDGEGNVLANQNLTFNVNGVFYNKTTASDGSADLNINLMRGKYIITSMWDDYQVGNKIEIV